MPLVIHGDKKEMSEVDREEKERRKMVMNHLFENRFRELKVYLENISKNEQNVKYLKKMIKKSKQRHIKALHNKIIDDFIWGDITDSDNKKNKK